jgi:hypothetical protein
MCYSVYIQYMVYMVYNYDNYCMCIYIPAVRAAAWSLSWSRNSSLSELHSFSAPKLCLNAALSPSISTALAAAAAAEAYVCMSYVVWGFRLSARKW